MSTILPSQRVPYSAIVDRPKLAVPDGGRMLVWVIVNVEHWGMERPMPRMVLSPPMGQPLQPDLPNWAWHEYGMRVGFWRIHDALKNLGIVPTLAINGIVSQSYPRVAQAALDLNWEFMGHGFVQGPMHAVADQRDAIKKTVDAIKAFTGTAPRGWESPGLTETADTIDHLAEAGIEYVAEMYERGVAQIDRLWQESATIPRVMAISVHPYITGAPHRIANFERLLAYAQAKPGVVIRTGADINDWYRAQVAPPA